MMACRANKNPAVAETLIRHGADVNIRNGVACSAFLFAARRADGLVLLRLLAERGADVLAADASLSNALHAACSGQSGLSSVRFLLSVGLPVNGRSGPDVIRLLLQHGADPSLRDLDGKRAGDELSVERIIWLKQNGLAEIL